MKTLLSPRDNQSAIGTETRATDEMVKMSVANSNCLAKRAMIKLRGQRHLVLYSSKECFLVFLAAIAVVVEPSFGQIQAGVYDFGESRFGEKRGSWTPGEWLSLILLLMTICLGLALSVGLCYYVNRRQNQKAASRLNYLKRRHVQASNNSLADVAPRSELAGRQSSVNSRLAQAELSKSPGPATQNSSFYRDYHLDNRPTPNASLVVQI